MACQRPARRAISFVVVHYSDEVFHNILLAESLKDPLNELIVVDNRHNLFHRNLSAAIREGLARARHPLVAVVHEDVLLPAGWQGELERSLAAVERDDPEWGCLGSVGWTAEGRLVGHWSDPKGYYNFFADERYVEAAKLDEQILIFHQERRIELDAGLPSIHNLGRDVALTARVAGRRTYVVDAPTIHKYADASGRRVLRAEDSPKIRARSTATWAAEKECCDDYFYRKWPAERPPEHTSAALDGDSGAAAAVAAPIVFVAGDGDAPLVADLAAAAGVFVGTATGPAGETLEMVKPVHKAIIATCQCVEPWQQASAPRELVRGAQEMLQPAGFPSPWGFVVPEAVLVLPEVMAAFPRARFVHLIRDPLANGLGGTQATAGLDHPIGQIALRLAYAYRERALTEILEDPPAVHLAYTSSHQLLTARALLDPLPAERAIEIRREELLHWPHRVRRRLGWWLREERPGRLRPFVPRAIDWLLGR